MKFKSLLLLVYLMVSSAAYCQVDEGISSLLAQFNDLQTLSADAEDEVDDSSLFTHGSASLAFESKVHAPETACSSNRIGQQLTSATIRGPPTQKHFT